jgi:hypothetical protein
MITFSRTIHFSARPEAKERLLQFFSSVLGLELKPVNLPYVTGSPEPMYAVHFENGVNLSMEFNEDGTSEEEIRKGPWFELKADDAEIIKQKALAFGLKQIHHPYTPFLYIQAPGGPVFRIVANGETV